MDVDNGESIIKDAVTSLSKSKQGICLYAGPCKIGGGKLKPEVKNKIFATIFKAILELA